MNTFPGIHKRDALSPLFPPPDFAAKKKCFHWCQQLYVCLAFRLCRCIVFFFFSLWRFSFLSASNPCEGNDGRGPCSHLCLINYNSTASCACPHLMKLSPDKQSCFGEHNDSSFVILFVSWQVATWRSRRSAITAASFDWHHPVRCPISVVIIFLIIFSYLWTSFWTVSWNQSKVAVLRGWKITHSILATAFAHRNNEAL